MLSLAERGEGILNVQTGTDYIARESSGRDNVGYIVKTDEATDTTIMASFQQKIAAGKRRRDLEESLGYRHNQTYQLRDDYDAAPLTGIGRSTCATMTAKACRASGDTRLERIAAAADQLYPKDVEQKLEELFEYKDKDGSGKKTESIFVERRFYPNGYPRHPFVTVQEAHAKTIEEDPDELKRERDERQRAWEEPKEHKTPTPAPKRVQKENASPSPEENP